MKKQDQAAWRSISTQLNNAPHQLPRFIFRPENFATCDTYSLGWIMFTAEGGILRSPNPEQNPWGCQQTRRPELHEGKIFHITNSPAAPAGNTPFTWDSFHAAQLAPEASGSSSWRRRTEAARRAWGRRCWWARRRRRARRRCAETCRPRRPPSWRHNGNTPSSPCSPPPPTPQSASGDAKGTPTRSSAPCRILESKHRSVIALFLSARCPLRARACTSCWNLSFFTVWHLGPCLGLHAPSSRLKHFLLHATLHSCQLILWILQFWKTTK